MTDDDFETALRATLRAGEQGAPRADRLAAAVATREGRRRRVAAVIATVAAVAMLSTTGAVLRAREPAAAPAAGSTADRTGVLRFRGVEVRVPVSWLDVTDTCPSPTTPDAAWVDRDSSDVCPAGANAQSTYVRLSSYASQPSAVPTDEPVAVRSDANTDVRTFADRGVAVRITSPDRELARQVLSTVRLLDESSSVDGCAVRAPSDPATVHAATKPLVPDADRGAALVCAYDGGWLSSTSQLAEAPGAALAGLLDSGQPTASDVFSCPAVPAGTDRDPRSWLMRFGSSAVTLTEACPGGPAGVVVASDGAARIATREVWVTVPRLPQVVPAPSPPAEASPPSLPVGELATCGSVPVSAGPSKDLVAATLHGPTSAVAGTDVAVSIVLRALTDRAVTMTSGLPVSVLVTRSGRIVGSYRGAVAGVGTSVTVLPGLSVPLGADGDYTPHVLLAGCTKGEASPVLPDSTRATLPPGEYDLVAVMEDAGDVLVSAPLRITVTAPPPDALGSVRVVVQVVGGPAPGTAQPLSGEVQLTRDGVVVTRADAAQPNTWVEMSAKPGSYDVRYAGMPSCATRVVIEPARVTQALLRCSVK